MKKVLLAMAGVVLASSAAFATDYKIFPISGQSWSANTDAKGFDASMTVNGKSFSINTQQDKSTTKLIEPSADQIRVYKSSKIIVNSSDFAMKTVKMKLYSTHAVEGVPGEGWKGSLADVNYTLTNANGAKSLEIAATNGQFRIAEIIVSDEESSGSATEGGYSSALGADFTFEKVSGEVEAWQHDATYGLKASAYISGAPNAYEGYAVSPVIDLTNAKESTLTFKNAYNQFKLNGTMIAPADFNKYCSIAVREAGATTWTELTGALSQPESFSWNYFDNAPVSLSAYVGKKIQVGFKYVSTAEIAGTWEIKEINITGAAGSDTPTPTVKEVNSIAEALALESGTVVKVNFPMTVTFVNNKNIWTIDDEGAAINIYGENTYAANDVIPAGWEGTFTVRYDVPQFTPSAALPAADGTSQFTPASVSNGVVNNSMVNQVLVIKDVNFAEATPAAKENFTGTSNGNTLNFRNNYTLPSVAAGDYDVKVVVNLYNGEPSLYVIEYLVKSAVEEIGVENGAAVYYDLNGRKVAGNLDKGIYVKVVNGKASKVVVK